MDKYVIATYKKCAEVQLEIVDGWHNLKQYIIDNFLTYHPICNPIQNTTLENYWKTIYEVVLRSTGNNIIIECDEANIIFRKVL